MNKIYTMYIKCHTVIYCTAFCGKNFLFETVFHV